jgi:hypothetical protein
MHETFIKVLGVIIIIISLHRAFYLTSEDRVAEINHLGLHSSFSSVIIICEIIMGALLLSNMESKKLLLQISLLFIVLNCLLMLYNNYNKILSTYKDIWTFQPTAMSYSLHLLYIFIIVILLYSNNMH